jgi:hypothetical protein
MVVQLLRSKKPKVRFAGRGDGLLMGLPPEAFENWVGQRFRDLGYDVQVTPFQGDHGIDIVLTKPGETVIVQCKHHPLSTIGEPILRDLFGTLHHVGAQSAALVTTGQLSKAARDWLVGKPIQVWDAPRLKLEWGAELAALAAQIARTVLPEGNSPMRAKRGTSWYVYTHRDGNRYAVELPRSIGDQVALGFEPLTDSTIPTLPRGLRMRHMHLKSVEPRPRYLKRIPYGKPTFPPSAWTEGLVFTSSTGRRTIWRILSASG